MCMQDLAIRRKGYWKPVVVAEADGGVRSVIPPSPDRIALVAWDQNLGVPASLALQLNGVTFPVGFQSTGVGGAVQPSVWIDAFTYPGVFQRPLYFNGAPSNLVAEEFVMDSDTSLSVQEIAATFGK